MINRHYGSIAINDIVADDRYSHTNSAKVLKSVEVDGRYYWITQHGAIQNNKFVPTAMSVKLISTSDLNSQYPMTWTKDKLSPKKGDILVGTSKNRPEKVYFYYLSDSLVHRFTEWDGSSNSSASLAFYQEKFPNLKVHLTDSGQKFSLV